MMGFGNGVRMIQVGQWGKDEPGGAGLVPTKGAVKTVKSRPFEPACAGSIPAVFWWWRMSC